MKVTEAMAAAAGAAWQSAKTVGNDLYPTFQAGLQDAQFLATRMTLDAPPEASVPGQAGVSTQRELYESQHEDWREQYQPEPATPADWQTSYEDHQQAMYNPHTPEQEPQHEAG